MKHVKKILSYSIAGSLGLAVVAGLQGCDSKQPGQPGTPNKDSIAENAKAENVFLVIQQTGENPDTYELAEKMPTSGPSRAILRDLSGNERILSQEELKKLAEEEAAKVEAGTSNLTKEPSATSSGLSLGETILASAAGALIGSWLASKLMGNANYQRHQERVGAGRPATTISRPAGTLQQGRFDPTKPIDAQKERDRLATEKNAAGKGAASPSAQPKSGFFGGGAGASSSSSSGSSSFGG